ncbi:response regulator, partial [Rubrivivax gelatinosus]|uniref:response regulator n=1 Tax=Rubrivivax gelatinosus TaxID=28068 RepID=UPI0005C19F4B
ASAAAPAADGGPAALRGRRVLLAEDNDLNQQVAVELLSELGLEVDVAENGLVAVEKVRSTHYDLVLMDIVAMTANAMQGDVQRCLNAGMDDHIAKPIDPNRLATQLLACLVRRPPAALPAPPPAPASADQGVLDIETGLRL